MYEEWFESLARDLKIMKVVDTSSYVELVICKEILDAIDIENLFVSVINITTNFQFKYKNEELTINLLKKNLEKHYIYYLIDLLLVVISSKR